MRRLLVQLSGLYLVAVAAFGGGSVLHDRPDWANAARTAAVEVKHAVSEWTEQTAASVHDSVTAWLDELTATQPSLRGSQPEEQPAPAAQVPVPVPKPVLARRREPAKTQVATAPQSPPLSPVHVNARTSHPRCASRASALGREHGAARHPTCRRSSSARRSDRARARQLTREPLLGVLREFRSVPLCKQSGPWAVGPAHVRLHQRRRRFAHASRLAGVDGTRGQRDRRQRRIAIDRNAGWILSTGSGPDAAPLHFGAMERADAVRDVLQLDRSRQRHRARHSRRRRRRIEPCWARVPAPDAYASHRRRRKTCSI